MYSHQHVMRIRLSSNKADSLAAKRSFFVLFKLVYFLIMRVIRCHHSFSSNEFASSLFTWSMQDETVDTLIQQKLLEFHVVLWWTTFITNLYASLNPACRHTALHTAPQPCTVWRLVSAAKCILTYRVKRKREKFSHWPYVNQIGVKRQRTADSVRWFSASTRLRTKTEAADAAVGQFLILEPETLLRGLDHGVCLRWNDHRLLRRWSLQPQRRDCNHRREESKPAGIEIIAHGDVQFALLRGIKPSHDDVFRWSGATRDVSFLETDSCYRQKSDQCAASCAHGESARNVVVPHGTAPAVFDVERSLWVGQWIWSATCRINGVHVLKLRLRHAKEH